MTKVPTILLKTSIVGFIISQPFTEKI